MLTSDVPKCAIPVLHSQWQKTRYAIIQEIAEIDKTLTRSVNAILHHPKFQQLEASWRGLEYLIDQGLNVNQLKIRILDVNWKVLADDLNRALEFDQSQLFKLIYTNEFDHPGGEPFGLLIGDYYVDHQYTENIHQIATLRGMSSIAAAAFSPFVTAANASFFGLNYYTELQSTINLERTFQLSDYLQWKMLRETDDARFLGLVLPRVLMRLPYTINDSNRQDQFCFNEKIVTSQDYLWGNAAYCFAAIAIRSFGEAGWFTEMRGTEKNAINKGVVTGLPRQYYPIGQFGLNYKPVTEACITNHQEQKLSALGFIALCECQYTKLSAFYSCISIQKPMLYDKDIATHNAELSSMLHYILCVSRFAHYIKIIIRNKIGAFNTANECESFLQSWLLTYTAVTDGMSPASKAKYPLREAKIRVSEQLQKPGSYSCIIQLKPHYQLDKLEGSLIISTELKF